MDREEAWNRIDAIIAKHEIDDEYVTITSILDYDALRMAREILGQDPCEDEELDFVQPHKKIKVNLVKFDTPYTDVISRQAAIDAMREETCGCCWDAKDILAHLPTVSTEKTGHWIDREVYDADRWKCSECGRTEPCRENYCPNCGAKMGVEE